MEKTLEGLDLISKERIEAIHPERLSTDCLSCRLQFHQLTGCPMEILREAYSGYNTDEPIG